MQRSNQRPNEKSNYSNFCTRAAIIIFFCSLCTRMVQAVFDPLFVLLELGEMRCGQVARIASGSLRGCGLRGPTGSASGARLGRGVLQWWLAPSSEPTLSGGGQTILVDGNLPSIADLTQRPPSWTVFHQRHEIGIYVDPVRGRLASRPYPSYYFFSKWAYGDLRNFIIKQLVQNRPLQVSGMVGGIIIGQRFDTTRELLDLKTSYEPGAPRGWRSVSRSRLAKRE